MLACTSNDEVAEELVSTGMYRLLRRLEVTEEPCCTGGDAQTLIGLAVDLESGGLDAAPPSIIECSMCRFRFDPKGAITKIDRPYTWLEDPGEPLDAVISQVTGLTDADLQGQRIDDATVTALARSAHVACAFNSASTVPSSSAAFRTVPAWSGRAPLSRSTGAPAASTAAVVPLAGCSHSAGISRRPRRATGAGRRRRSDRDPPTRRREWPYRLLGDDGDRRLERIGFSPTKLERMRKESLTMWGLT